MPRYCVASVKRFHVHLACAPFYVFTDHQALASLLTMKDPTRRIAGWLITLGEYPFIAVYRKGSLNGDADALSRLRAFPVENPQPLPQALPGFLDLDLTSLIEATQLIGRHFLDSTENIEYIITDVWENEETGLMVGSNSKQTF
eukprot:gene62031-biopygen39925